MHNVFVVRELHNVTDAVMFSFDSNRRTLKFFIIQPLYSLFKKKTISNHSITSFLFKKTIRTFVQTYLLGNIKLTSLYLKLR
jgi:AAA15 family ATPase/GTPase